MPNATPLNLLPDQQQAQRAFAAAAALPSLQDRLAELERARAEHRKLDAEYEAALAALKPLREKRDAAAWAHNAAVGRVVTPATADELEQLRALVPADPDKSHACCGFARPRRCACASAWFCRIHGSRHHGTHD